MKKFSLTILVSAAALCLGGTVQAQNLHPEYQHAMSNLDAAHKLLDKIQKASAASDIAGAGKEIDAAYRDLRTAARDDDKDLATRFPPDFEKGNAGPLHKVRHLLEVAHKETAAQEDDAAAQATQQRALGHIDAALRQLDAAIAAPGAATSEGGSAAANKGAGAGTAGDSGGAKPGSLIQEHPAYLHALSDLREARGYLSNDKRGGLGKEEQEAIDEIDRTIQDIHKASLDDGKDLNDHPPVDAKLDHKGILHHALALAGKARSDISMKETNGFAQNLRQRALDHLDRIEHHLNAALAVTEGK